MVIAIFGMVLPLLSLYAGVQVGQQQSPHLGEHEAVADGSIQLLIQQQQTEVKALKSQAEDNLNALAIRLGEMQARIARLDAVGRNLVARSDLDDGEFDFSAPPPMGGPESEPSWRPEPLVPDFLAQLEELSQRLEDREAQLTILQSALINQSLQDEVIPSGRPVTSGWISSRFGSRKDPFTGKPDMHQGIDIAGTEGSDVISVGAGVVMWSEQRYGYGMMVEINHGNGFVTRYGHNKENLVEVGDTVQKGQRIAIMGNTGRSTGPHVHYEVRRNGQAVDPMKFLQVSKR